MNLIAVGGGDIRTGATLAIDRELVRLAAKARPRLLFLPTASDDDAGYVAAVEQNFGERLGCDVDTLLLWRRDRDPETIRAKVADADAIYVGGGNTKAMIALWRELGVDRRLREHVDQGKPAGGLSAGALCWFRLGNSDWPQYEGIPNVNTASLECLGFVDLVLCPHTRDEGFRLNEFRAMLRGGSDVGVGLDDGCALQVRDDEYRILASQPGSVAHKIWWEGETPHERILEPHPDFRPLGELRTPG